ncbi:MAG: menaquinone biosynthesis family protein [Planctomycetota bacterium]
MTTPPTRPIHLGISTCPNDTFTFHALLQNKVDTRGLEFRIELMDVQELNNRLFAGEFDVAKASFHAALLLANDLGVLPTGSALGFGNGPLLLAAQPETTPASVPNPRILTPGAHTTANLLYRLFYPGPGTIDNVVFSDIMPALQNGAADFGVCIHEGRFTYNEQGLRLVEDLGERWEQTTGAPLPLGGILGRYALGEETLSTIQAVLLDSLDYALTHRDETLESMRAHAQEFSDETLFAHVDLYVNEHTRDLGSTGQHALDQLNAQAARAGIVPKGLAPLRIVAV